MLFSNFNGLKAFSNVSFFDFKSGIESKPLLTTFTTANFAPKNKIVGWFTGGLNRQKVQVKKGHPGDNELTAEDLANSLTTQYESFKKQYQAEATKATESKK